MSLNRLGLYDDQTIGGLNVISEDYLTTHGFEKVTDINDVKPGDIINIKDSSGKWCHTYVIETYDDKTKLCSKYDMGSDERVNHVQPYKDVPIVEEPWIQNGESFMNIYRVKE